MVNGFAKTPRYFLNDGAYPTCPSFVQASSDEHATVIFAYLDKPEYDVFVSVSSLMLTPNPRVKGFLKGKIERDSGSIKLIVLDAVFSGQQFLYAATFQAVLESFRLDSEAVLRAIEQIVGAAERWDCPVSVCGDELTLHGDSDQHSQQILGSPQ